jgi:hypothetical protein
VVAVVLSNILTDEQWAEVVRHSGLPPDARPIIENAIVGYRRRLAILDRRKRPAKIRMELECLRKEADALMNHLDSAMSDFQTLGPLVFPFPPPKGWPPNTGPVPHELANQRLNGTLYELERLVCWLGLARDRVRDAKRGTEPKATQTYFLVHFLDFVLKEFTGRVIISINKAWARHDKIRDDGMSDCRSQNGQWYDR